MANSIYRPPVFTGSATQDVEDWLDSYERYAEFTNWDDRRKYTGLRNMLQDGAARWLRTQEDVHEYEDLKNRLVEKYLPKPATLFQLRQALMDRKQKTGESVTDYAASISHMCSKLGITQTEELHYFIQGLQDNNKRQVLRNQPATLDEAVSAAQAEETAQKIKPIRKRAYRLNPTQKHVLEGMIQDMSEQNIIQPSTSPWGAPCLLVSKGNNKGYRFVVDFRGLNQLIELEATPIPTTEEALDSIGASKPAYFTTLDLQSGFYQVSIDPNSYNSWVTFDDLSPECQNLVQRSTSIPTKGQHKL